MNDNLANEDRALFRILADESQRQETILEMIASESLQSPAMLALAGSIFNNKTAVGNPGHQRLMGSGCAERLERLAAERACAVFGAEHANITPYSGSVANYCAYASCLDAGDPVVALAPSAGSHQTHGGNQNISQRLYRFRYFGLHPDTMLVNYEEAEALVRGYRPKLLVIGSSAYSRDLDYERFAEIAHRNGARLLVDLAHFTGLVAAGVSPNPVPYADIVTISGTKTMCGPHTGVLLCKQEMAEAVDRSVHPGYISSIHLQTVAALTYALYRTQTAEFRSLMRQVVRNARTLAQALRNRGFGIVTGGTDCHMFVADLRPFGVDGCSFAEQMEDIGISVNTKGIPYDSSPVPNGIRAGSVVLTQRGMQEEQMEEIAGIWERVAKARGDADQLASARAEVQGLVRRFSLRRAVGI